jgi:hypothetical protein
VSVEQMRVQPVVNYAHRELVYQNCRKKSRFYSEATAKLVIEGLQRRKKRTHNLRAYRCPTCS